MLAYLVDRKRKKRKKRKRKRRKNRTDAWFELFPASDGLAGWLAHLPFATYLFTISGRRRKGRKKKKKERERKKERKKEGEREKEREREQD